MGTILTPFAMDIVLKLYDHHYYDSQTMNEAISNCVDI